MAIPRARDARVRLRIVLLGLGARASGKPLAMLRASVAYLELGAQLQTPLGKLRPEVVSDDFSVFEVTRDAIIGTRPLYLEFGVFEGRSIRWWCEHLDQPGALFVGFDSFEGLPEDWQPGFPAGFFKTGAPPEIDDKRVSFVTGWFDETLPKFKLPDHDQLIVNIDCDLYSSATTVLSWLEPHICHGTMIYFDEFPNPRHEMRAFLEFLTRSHRTAIPRAVSRNTYHWLFEIV